MATATNVENVNATPAVQLSENFFISTKKQQTVRIQVVLNESGIFLRRQTTVADHINEQLLRLEDIVGSHCGERLKKRNRGRLTSCRTANDADGDTEQGRQSGSGAQKDVSAYLYVYAYVRTETPLRRNRTVRILRFRSEDAHEENLRIARRWHEGILTNKQRQQRLWYTTQRPLLVLLNPKSGSGKGREMFQKQMAPVLKEAEIPYELLVTTHENHARELVRKRQDLVERYAAVVVASGDGLLFEVLNGIMERPDWRQVTQSLPMGIIPCGSGNGLAKSIAYLYREPYEPKPILYSALTCISGNYAAMDVVRVETSSVNSGSGAAKNNILYSFLSIGWGLMADIDIESERLRKIGATRFTIWSIHRVLSLRSYKAKIYYIPWRPDGSPTSAPMMNRNATAAAADEGEDDDFVQQSNGGFKDLPDAYSAQGSDEFQDVLSVGKGSSRMPRDSWHSAASKRTAYYSLDGQSIGFGSQRNAPANMSRRIHLANAMWEAKALTSTLPPLSESLADRPEWVCEQGEYILLHTGTTTHIGADMLFAPDSRLNDGIIYLVIIRAGISRSQLVQFLLSMSDGTHLPLQPHEHIRVLQVRAFRLEPISTEQQAAQPKQQSEQQPPQQGIITVDGERVEYGPIQCEVFPGLVNVLVPHEKQ